MGRPPLFMIRIHTTLTAHALNRMDNILGEKGRLAFFRKAVDQLLVAIEAGEQMKAKKVKAGE